MALHAPRRSLRRATSAPNPGPKQAGTRRDSVLAPSQPENITMKQDSARWCNCWNACIRFLGLARCHSLLGWDPRPGARREGRIASHFLKRNGVSGFLLRIRLSASPEGQELLRGEWHEGPGYGHGRRGQVFSAGHGWGPALSRLCCSHPSARRFNLTNACIHASRPTVQGLSPSQIRLPDLRVSSLIGHHVAEGTGLVALIWNYAETFGSAVLPPAAAAAAACVCSQISSRPVPEKDPHCGVM